MMRTCPDLARFAAAATLALLLAGRAGAETPDSVLHTLSLQALSPSGAARILDWRGERSKINLVLPPGLEADNLRIVLTAQPGDLAPVPHAWIEVRLNGSPPGVLRPEPYPFTAQVDFPASYLRDGPNEAVISYVSPTGTCPTPEDGAWRLDLRDSRIELTAPPARIETVSALDALLRAELTSPRRVAIATDGMGPDDAAGFQVWTAIAAGLRAPRVPAFVLDGGAAELAVQGILDPAAEKARAEFSQGPGGAPMLTVRAATAEAATGWMQAWAAEAAQGFAAPQFDSAWRPEPGHADFVLDERPSRARLRLEIDRAAEGGPDSRLHIALNGRSIASASLSEARRGLDIAAPLHLLRPGRNRVTIAPDLVPAGEPDTMCGPAGTPRIAVAGLRLDHDRAPGAEETLFGFAAGSLARGSLILPAGTARDRAAQLRLVAAIARNAGRAPEIGAVAAAPHAMEMGETVLIAPQGAIPPGWLDAAPASLHGALRAARRERDGLRLISRAMAAPPGVLEAPVIAGAAARYALPESGATLVLVTAGGGADFAASIERLVDSGMLSVFDGRVMRWDRDEAMMQDRGVWQAPPLRLPPPPPTSGELQRTLLFLIILGGLSLGWAMVRRRPGR